MWILSFILIKIIHTHIYIVLIPKRYISIEIFHSSSQTKTASSTKLT